MAEYHLDQGQRDTLWSYVGHKGEKRLPRNRRIKEGFWWAAMIESSIRRRAAREMGKSEIEAAIEVFQTLKRRGHSDVPPPTVSHGCGGIRDAMEEVYGKMPAYTGRSDRRPRSGLKAGHMQVVKQGEKGHVVGLRLRVVYGNQEDVLRLLVHNTAYVKGTHLTSRHLGSRLTRKTPACSQALEMHRAAAVWENIVYNLVCPLKTLRLEVGDDPQHRCSPRTPATAAGLTDHVWTIKEILAIWPLYSSLLEILDGKTASLQRSLESRPGMGYK